MGYINETGYRVITLQFDNAGSFEKWFGHKVLPTIFIKNIQRDSMIVEHTDSLVIEFRRDTIELHK